MSVADVLDPSLADDATGHAAASLTPAELDSDNRAAHARGQEAVETTVSALLGQTTLQDAVEARVIEGEPGPALCKLATDEGASVIVVGSRGRGGIKRALLGSVSDYVVRNAPCSVVVTR